MTTDERLAELEKQVSEHLARRPVKVVWSRQGPSASGVGQVTKSMTGELIVFIAPLEGLSSRYSTWLHELAHIRHGDHEFIARSNDHKRAPGSKQRTPQARAEWRADPREKRAQALTETWKKYAEKYAYRYHKIGMTQMYAKLSCLLEWPKLNAKEVNRWRGSIK